MGILWFGIPSEMMVPELTEEDAAAGMVAVFSAEEGSYQRLCAMSCLLPDYDMTGAVYLFDEGWVLAFNFSGASDEGLAALSASILSSVRPAE
ncbi:MAG: hypothetical protein IJA26_03975 [Clostridia bacterium]|nr:hypothetical protein [Clostridia bacterium]